ncbi:MAG: acetyl-CoA carboxylase biotin carboxyl carrier protein [Nitrospirota bacterium]|nr:acetyl-CoA carboxylase biotin carboxyl carrier protein [Nitrospirota bacterium]
MELEDLKSLIEFLKETDITELRIERDNSKVRIKRGQVVSSLEVPAPKPAAVQAPPAEEVEKQEEKLHTVASPIVGTFYRSPTPEAAPFVDVGLEVTRGQVLCIIEAMKLMNEIESEVDGVIARVLVENGQAVEYGEPLFQIEPA